ncbi:hypothetical protein AKJ45_02205 [candidate division MSBL1 archaeon SCGC-AAA261F19]|uniref:DUF3368 domain-containing protein n=1 Tax=candidate division MSBL1 archaeon SCGC-AAA261F19 TaxID=1698275 RepID=A0A133V9W7_9EURY|nr:hypothetical protein AKJ45_02205 [candidate division MSBL1 archaeon SCGC-AAA261F19]
MVSLKAVSNSTPLIYLAKVSKLNLLKKLFNEIIVSEEVYEEVVLKGKERGEPEVYVISDFFEEGFIQKEETRRPKRKSRGLHEAELKAIGLCEEEKIGHILVDDKEAFELAKLLGLEPWRTSSIILKFFELGEIDYHELRKTLQDLSSAGYFMTAEVYELILGRARS